MLQLRPSAANKETFWRKKKKDVLGLVAQLCLTLWDPMDYSLLGPSIHGDSPGKNTGVFPSRNRTQISHIVGWFFTIWATREAQEYWNG